MPTKANTTGLTQELTEIVKQAGYLALTAQQAVHGAQRSYKVDDSVVTAADREVEDFLVEEITALHPGANIITEESKHPFNVDRALTFAIDPIDGTDVYSQGMPGWSVSVGLFNRDLRPTAGVIVAPRLDLLLVAEDGAGATLNGSPLAPPDVRESISVRSNLMVTSRIHKALDLREYVGKIRGIGSAALHLCYPFIYVPVIGALEGPGVHIWDIAAAHAVNLALGEDLRYLSGKPIDYPNMLRGEPGADVVVAAPGPRFDALRAMLKRLPPESERSAP